MTKYLVFGDGLLGNTFRLALPKASVVLSKEQCDITNKDSIKRAIRQYNPHVVINAAGIVPKNSVPIDYMFKVNSFAPHYIADECARKCKFIHISTDCVFSGERGKYTEKDAMDATDTYGMSKIFGEPTEALVIRTSFIGLPDPKGRGLLAWASRQLELTGYDKVFWNGVTTLELLKQIEIFADQNITGIRHIYSYTVSKYELLKCAKDVFEWSMPVYKESDTEETPHAVDKTLNSVYATGFVAKPLKRQLKEMKNALC